MAIPAVAVHLCGKAACGKWSEVVGRSGQVIFAVVFPKNKQFQQSTVFPNIREPQSQ